MEKPSIRGVKVSVVVIGRNEGARLVECLHSLVSQTECIVYVDSGSTDSSCEEARRLGANVVDLDMSLPFTAARARNAGLNRVFDLTPNCDAVMFVDGDCAIADGFLNAGARKLAEDERIAVCSRSSS